MGVPLHIAVPEGVPLGGLIVCQEAFGVTEHIEDVCDRYAAAGYLAVAPAFFHRAGDPPPIVAYDDIPAAVEQMSQLHADDVLADVDAALAALAERHIAADRSGIVGFCMGGTIAFHVATQRRLGASVTFYGGGISQERMGFPPMFDVAGTLQTPWLGLFGDRDASIPVEEVEQLRVAVAGADAPTDVVRYAECQHGFHCDHRPTAFDAEAAADAHTRALEWFATHLS